MSLSWLKHGLAGALLALAALLASTSALAQEFTDPLINTAQVTLPAGISDPVLGNNTAQDSNALAASTVDAVDDTSVTAHATLATTVVGGNDVAVNGTLGAITGNTQGTNGTVACTGTGATSSCTYTPTAGFSGADSYTYTICLAAPNTGICDTATVSVVVGPDAVDDVASTTQSTPVSGDVSVNDVSAPGSVFAATGTPVGGTVEVSADGTYTYTPTAGFTGSGSFQYTVCLPAPNGSVCDTATVTVSVGASTPESDLSVVKTLLTGSPAAAGSVVSYQVVLSNAGPDVAVGATVTDTVPAELTNVTWTCTASGSSSCGVASGSGNAISLTATVGVGGGNAVTVLVSGTAPASGTIGANTAVVSVPVGTTDPTPGDNTDTVPAIPVTPAMLAIDAVDDSAGPIDGLSGGTAVVNVLTNDTLGANPVVPSEITLTPNNANPLTINADGSVDVAPNTPAGTYMATYRICQVAKPENCDSATVIVSVGGGVISVRLTKRALQRRVKQGELVRYTITAENTSSLPVADAILVDAIPAGFGYVEGSLVVDDDDDVSQLIGSSPLAIAGLDLAPGHQATITYYLRAGSGVGPGIHTNRAVVRDEAGHPVSNEASVDVEVTGDPLLEDSLIVGTIFDDRNGNGIQETGERGVPGVRIASVEGLVMETDAFGRYHLVGVQSAGFNRGRLFILKVDPNTLPEGTTFTTENPRVRRITPGLPVRFDFGVRLPAGATGSGQNQVEIELGEVIFSPGTALVPESSSAMFDRIAATIREHGGGRITIAATADAEALAFQRALAVQEELKRRLDAEIAAQTHIDVTTELNPATPLVSLHDAIGLSQLLFDTDKSAIRPEFRVLIQQVAAAINARGSGLLVITGRADLRASDDYNQRLGMRRARAVMAAISAELDPEVRRKLRVEVESPSGTLGVDGG